MTNETLCGHFSLGNDHCPWYTLLDRATDTVTEVSERAATEIDITWLRYSRCMEQIFPLSKYNPFKDTDGKYQDA